MARDNRPPRNIVVIDKIQLSPNMLRIRFGGPDLADFPADTDSAYIKMRITEPGPNREESPIIRTYTVRRFDVTSRELDVDFVLHGIAGPAAEWAQRCLPGDSIRITGPGPTKLVDHRGDWFLFAGDMSALPAISANLEKLPDSARGIALLEIIDAADRQELKVPANLSVFWLENSHPEVANTMLLDAIRDIEWLNGTPSIWVAGEFSQSLTIRQFLRSERKVDRDKMYVSSYWQIGKTEDGHRISKAGL